MKSILITGASGGIGRSLAVMATKNGYHVCLHYNNNYSAVELLHKEIVSQGGSADIYQADISNEKSVATMFKEIKSKHDSLYALINNAGIIYKSSKLEDLNEERIKSVLNINVLGYMLCSKYSIKLMSTKYGHNGGRIINVSSAASRLGSPNEYIDYACSKGAIDTLTRGLSLELADEGILVNCVRPGFIHTDIHKLSGDPNRIEKLKDKIPLKRGGMPDEVSSAIIWLLSEGSSYTTGSFIDIAGGK
jgi:NAD(P)-dependent dehydrogenase (short-subunit alcohol dehydrogenase family)